MVFSNTFLAPTMSADLLYAQLCGPFISRYPEDILRIIFEYTIEGPIHNHLRAALTISHVCKYWREIALEMRSLWKNIFISVDNPPYDVGSLMECIRARVHSTPVEVTVANIGKKPIDTTKELFDSLQLYNFTSINLLHFSLWSSMDAEHLTEPVFGSQSGSIKAITVTTTWRPMGPILIWDVARMLRYFPGVEILRLHNLDTVVLGGEDEFPFLHELCVSDIDITSLSLQLPRLQNLERLKIGGDFRLYPVPDDIVMPKLTSIEIIKTKGFPWNRLSTPRLVNLATDDSHSDVIDFLCRHSSIQFLRYRVTITQEDFTRLSSHLTRLELLIISCDIDKRFTTLDSETGLLPFPQLQTLSLVLRGDYIPPLQSIEELVQVRCRRSPESDRGDVRLLASCNISAKLSTLEQAEWRASPLLENCYQNIHLWKNGKWGILPLKWTR